MSMSSITRIIYIYRGKSDLYEYAKDEQLLDPFPERLVVVVLGLFCLPVMLIFFCPTMPSSPAQGSLASISLADWRIAALLVPVDCPKLLSAAYLHMIQVTILARLHCLLLVVCICTRTASFSTARSPFRFSRCLWTLVVSM